MSALKNCLRHRRRGWDDAADVPWDLDSAEGTDGGGRLFRYLRGGGLRSFRHSTAQMRAERRQTRFLWIFAVLAAAWLAVWAV